MAVGTIDGPCVQVPQLGFMWKKISIIPFEKVNDNWISPRQKNVEEMDQFVRLAH